MERNQENGTQIFMILMINYDKNSRRLVSPQSLSYTNFHK